MNDARDTCRRFARTGGTLVLSAMIANSAIAAVGLQAAPPTTPQASSAAATPSDKPRRAVERAPTQERSVGPIRTEAQSGEITVVRTLTPRTVWEPGVPIEYQLEVSAPAGSVVDFPVMQGDFGKFEVRNRTTRSSSGESQSSMTATLIAWEAGAMEIPAQEITLTVPGAKAEKLTLAAAPVVIASLLKEDAPLTELASDIRGPVDIATRSWWWWAIAVGAGALGLGCIWWLRMRPTHIEEADPIPAGEWALGELSRLEAERLPERGDVEGFFVQLSDVVRQYIERRFSISAPECTTEEFLREARRHPDLARTHGASIGAFLKSADLVKFAAARPSAEVCANALESMRNFVEATAVEPESVAIVEENLLVPPVHPRDESDSVPQQEVRR